MPLGLVWEDRALSCAVSDSPGYLHHVGLVFLDAAEQRFHGPPSSNNILCKKQKAHQSNLHSILFFTFAELFLINKMHIYFKGQPIRVHTESRISYVFMGISFGSWKPCWWIFFLHPSAVLKDSVPPLGSMWVLPHWVDPHSRMHSQGLNLAWRLHFTKEETHEFSWTWDVHLNTLRG